MKMKKIAVSVLAAGLMASPLAFATNGMFPVGYGAKTEGMGGASIALPQDSIAAANNPAGMVFVGDHTDVGLIWFKPNRGADISGNICGSGCSMDGSYDGNGKADFFIPSFGYNRMINSNTSIGVSVFGNGGMNTQYDTNPLGALGASGPMGINLEQLFIAPTWSMKYNATNSVGVALNLAYQRFSATGLQPFDCLTYFGVCSDGAGGTTTNPAFSPTSNPGSMTNNGDDSSTGYGVRVGWMGEIRPNVTLGVTYQTKTKMGKFSKYSGLFADEGSFDIPANYGFGVAVNVNPATKVAFDVQRIDFEGVHTIGASTHIAQQYGSNGGPGFGWKSINAYKLGVSHAYSSNFTLRAGYDHCDQPISSNEAFLNILAPGVVQDHLTLGGTWTLANKSEVTVAYVHAFEQTVTGAVPSTLGGGNLKLKMHQDSISVAYGW
jgi:long-chain fatty acid transport protein